MDYTSTIILENKLNYIILFVGIFLASFLLLFGIGFKPMFDGYEKNIDRTLKYDYQYILKAPVENDEGEKLSITELKTYCSATKKDEDVILYGIEEDSEYFETGDLPEYENEAIISTQVAGKFKLNKGDSFTVKDLKHDKEYKFYVTGIYEHESTMGVFLNRKLLNNLLENDENYFNGYVSNKELDIDEKYIAKPEKQRLEKFTTFLKLHIDSPL